MFRNEPGTQSGDLGYADLIEKGTRNMKEMATKEQQIKEHLTQSMEMIEQIDVNDLPQIISSQIDQIKALDEKVIAALESADKAEEKAQIAKGKKVGVLRGKVDAIESLQDATYDTAQAVQNLADAVGESFEYSKKLSEITKYLFALGISNITATRTVVRELELSLKGASSEKISDLAKRELLGVISQLKAQEDIMDKQERQSAQIKKQMEKDREHDRLLAEVAQADQEQDELIAQNAARVEEHADLLEEFAQADQEQDELIARNAARVEEHTDLLEEFAQADQEQDELIAQNAAKVEEHTVLLAESAQTDQEQDELIAQQGRLAKQNEARIVKMEEQLGALQSVTEGKGSKVLVAAATLMSAVALILSVLHFFI